MTQYRLSCGHYATEPAADCKACAMRNPGDALFDRVTDPPLLVTAPDLWLSAGDLHRSNWHTPYERR